MRVLGCQGTSSISNCPHHKRQFMDKQPVFSTARESIKTTIKQPATITAVKSTLTLNRPRFHEGLRSACWVSTQPMPTIGPLDTTILTHYFVSTPVGCSSCVIRGWVGGAKGAVGGMYVGQYSAA